MADSQGSSVQKKYQEMETTTNLLAKTWLKQYFDDTNFPEWTKTQTGITVPLTLPEKPTSDFGKPRETCCLICNDTFLIPEKERDFFAHLLESHSIVIGDVHLISDIPAYISYWRNKFLNRPLTEFCSVMTAETELSDKGCQETKQRQFYFLSDVILEDKELRIHLQLRKLDQVLGVQESERRDPSFSRTCLFCRGTFDGSGAYLDLFNHMAFDHNFSVGQPNNLVYINELLDLLEGKLENLACIYCEKTFKSRDILKEHMRKKGHKKINPKNTAYDRFYLVNYVELGKTWQDRLNSEELRGESFESVEEELAGLGFDSDETEGDGDEDWGDWTGDLSGIVCLFCSAIYTELSDLLNHMDIVHNFDYKKLKLKMNLTFYQQIKLINFIRRQVHLNLCIYCSKTFDNKDELLEHMQMESHMKPPLDSSEWDQPQYFFSTYENDHLLHNLEDDRRPSEDKESPPVIAEEVLVKDSILMQSEVRNELLPSKTNRLTAKQKTMSVKA